MSAATDTQTKICHGCMASLPIGARECPYCGQKQLTRFEVGVERVMQKVFSRHAAASRALFFLMVVYFLVITVDIVMHPDYGLVDALLEPPGDLVYRWGAHLRGDLVWWRLITANFVHFGVLHIAFNAYALRYVSPYVERAYGSALTFSSFLVLGTGSMLCSNVFGDVGLVAGASGGLMGFIGLAAASAHRENTALSREVRNSMLRWAGLTMILGILVSMSGTVGVDNIAHASGFVLGVGFGYLLPTQTATGFSQLWMIRGSRILCALLVGVLLASFVFMMGASVSSKHQNACISDLKLKSWEKAEIACAMAYRADKSQMISYHNYILVSIINGQVERARGLCVEGRRRFRHAKRPLSFDEMCRSIDG
ncbi:MAG: rhomboid family intramembrane serine protease [Bradymonadia bacterium]